MGQNWAAGYKNFSAAISGWHSEKSRWRYGVSYKSGFGHYFQVSVDKERFRDKKTTQKHLDLSCPVLKSNNNISKKALLFLSFL